jgi:hypothetical protein
MNDILDIANINPTPIQSETSVVFNKATNEQLSKPPQFREAEQDDYENF